MPTSLKRTSAKSNPKLDIFDFGERLITSKDIDPTYVLLWEAKLDHAHLCRWLIGYFCFYSVGTASVLSEKLAFFGSLLEAVPGTRYPRGSERRHFRGEAALKSARSLLELRLTCAELIDRLGGQEPLPLRVVLDKVKRLRGFGDWIAFKVADILERLNLSPIQFSPTDVFSMFKAPREGAELMAEKMKYRGDNVYLWAHDTLLNKLGHLLAPPRYERTINIQEIETILCKFHSHIGGHYPLGKDTREIREGLLKYSKCKTSQRLLAAGKSGGLWE